MPWAVASATTARLQLIAADKSRKIRLPVSAAMKARVMWVLGWVEIIDLGPVHGSATVSTSLLMPEDSISFRSARASLAILGRGHACSAARADMYRTAGPRAGATAARSR
jgi:hypothetical protein